MKRLLLSLTFVAIFASQAFAGLEVFFMYSKFNSPQGQYIETYMSTIGGSTNFVKNANGKWQSEIEILTTFKINDSIVKFDKYILKSPEIADSADAKPNFIDVQRINLAEGTYKFEITIKDVNSDQLPYSFSDEITLNFNDSDLQFSDMQILESYSKSSSESVITKSGYDLVPYVANFFPDNMTSIKFYLELYNSDKVINDDYIFKFYIENYESGNEFKATVRQKKQKPGSIVPFIAEIPLDNVPSGNYNLVAEIRNRNNEVLLQKKYFFQRLNSKKFSTDDIADKVKSMDLASIFGNSINTIDTIANYIRSMRPIADVYEQKFIDFQLKTANIETMQNYFVEFWLKRNYLNPGEEWNNYYKQVLLVEKNYATFKRHGYETDRGIVYLHYGAPNHVYVSPIEPGAYPYEIWQYYRISNENNCKFVFYNPNLAGENYELLHSNKQGEIKTNNWTRYLTRSKAMSYGESDAYNSNDNITTHSYANEWERRAIEEFNK